MGEIFLLQLPHFMCVNKSIHTGGEHHHTFIFIPASFPFSHSMGGCDFTQVISSCTLLRVLFPPSGSPWVGMFDEERKLALKFELLQERLGLLKDVYFHSAATRKHWPFQLRGLPCFLNEVRCLCVRVSKGNPRASISETGFEVLRGPSPPPHQRWVSRNLSAAPIRFEI